MSNSFTIATVAVVVASAESKSVLDGKGLTIKPVIGGFLLGLALFAVNGAAPELGNKFNWLLIIGALLVNGSSFFKLLTPKD